MKMAIIAAALSLAACATTHPGFVQMQAYPALQRPAYVVPQNSQPSTDPDYLQRVQMYQALQRPAYVLPPPPQMIPNHSPPNYVCSPGMQNTLSCQAQ